ARRKRNVGLHRVEPFECGHASSLFAKIRRVAEGATSGALRVGARHRALRRVGALRGLEVEMQRHLALDLSRMAFGLKQRAGAIAQSVDDRHETPRWA